MAKRFKDKDAKAKGATPDASNEAQPAPPVVVTDDVIRKHALRVAKLKAAVDSANGEYRAALKAAKTDGIDPTDLSWYLSTKKRELEDVTREAQRRARIAVVMQLPLGLIDPTSGKSIATLVEEAMKEPTTGAKVKPPSQRDAAAAKKAGRVAGSTGKSREDCPMTHPLLKDAWLAGWTMEQEKITRKMGDAETAGATLN